MVQTKPNIKYTCEYGYPRIPPPPPPRLIQSSTLPHFSRERIPPASPGTPLRFLLSAPHRAPMPRAPQPRPPAAAPTEQRPAGDNPGADQPGGTPGRAPLRGPRYGGAGPAADRQRVAAAAAERNEREGTGKGRGWRGAAAGLCVGTVTGPRTAGARRFPTPCGQV